MWNSEFQNDLLRLQGGNISVDVTQDEAQAISVTAGFLLGELSFAEYQQYFPSTREVTAVTVHQPNADILHTHPDYPRAFILRLLRQIPGCEGYQAIDYTLSGEGLVELRDGIRESIRFVHELAVDDDDDDYEEEDESDLVEDIDELEEAFAS